MNGYECPCRGEFISRWGTMRARDCPSCKATIADQREERMIHKRADDIKARLLNIMRQA